MRLSWHVGLMLLVSGCGAFRGRAPRPFVPDDIASNPAVLYDRSLPYGRMTLFGVKLGDDESAIAPSRIENRAKHGWIVCSDYSKYRIEDGKVITLSMWNPEAIKKLNIQTQADIETRFGKAEQIEKADPLVIYRFQNGHVSVVWSTFEDQVNVVNVSR